MSYYDSSGQAEYSFTKPYSEKTAEIIDHEISKIIEAGYERAKKILLDNKVKVEQLASVLLDKEVIFREDLEEIFGKRPFEDEAPLPATEVKEGLSEAETKETEKDKSEIKKENSEEDQAVS
jgi:cell division protease FtsH